MNIPPSQHVTNAAAISLPAMSWALSLPETVTMVVGILGAIYYLMLMFDWIMKKIKTYQQIKQSSRRIAAPILEDHDVARALDKNPPSAD